MDLDTRIQRFLNEMKRVFEESTYRSRKHLPPLGVNLEKRIVSKETSCLRIYTIRELGLYHSYAQGNVRIFRALWKARPRPLIWLGNPSSREQDSMWNLVLEEHVGETCVQIPRDVTQLIAQYAAMQRPRSWNYFWSDPYCTNGSVLWSRLIADEEQPPKAMVSYPPPKPFFPASRKRSKAPHRIQQPRKTHPTLQQTRWRRRRLQRKRPNKGSS